MPLLWVPISRLLSVLNYHKLVNREKESLLTNERVQECLATAKQARKQLVRYIQVAESLKIMSVLTVASAC